ncbi:MAG: GH36-type glycosyl hydrolase domain-containing protein [Candidatus Thorarchaeota archaeon]
MIQISRKTFGSGNFGEWINDEYGLPAYHYTCNHLEDPRAITQTNKQWRPGNEHLHQVGNDRVVGVASNYGHIQLRQDEGSPKYLNDFIPEENHYAGGFGYLSDGNTLLSTYYPGNSESFERIFGMGYYRKTVKGQGLKADQIIFAPYGDDPLLISQVTITNERDTPVDVTWTEYWGCQTYQFSFKALARALASRKIHPNQFRRRMSKRFAHNISVTSSNSGLVDSQIFQGDALRDRISWGTLSFLLKFGGKKLTGGRSVKPPVKEAVLEDITLPPIFLVSLDDSFDDCGTDANAFFGEGGVLSPDGLNNLQLEQPDSSQDSATGLFLQRQLQLQPNESKTIQFAYGYIPEGFDLESLIAKYKGDDIFAKSCDSWKKDRIELDLIDEEWVDRELSWHNYYLRSNLTYDSFFKEHIQSQGHVYQYIIGFQGAARDPLQHALPFIYTDGTIVKEVLRYTLKTVTTEGEIPYGIVGSGMVMPSPFRPSDQEMWLLWLASEYVLATRDNEFLDEILPTYPVYGKKAGSASVRELLARCYRHLVDTTGTGRHGLQRLSNGDWNDAMVIGYAPEEEHDNVEEVGESVLNAAMAGYALDIYSRLLDYIGDSKFAEEVRIYTEKQRQAVREQWTGKWFKRAWLTEEIGWVGEDNLWLEPQPWTIIGGAADSEMAKILSQSIDDLLRKPTKAGAIILAKPDEKMVGAPGTGTNSGVWPSINGTLIWALALVNGEMGWDEWKKNSQAVRAESYPDVWYDIWSGPDTYNSDLAKRPGETMLSADSGLLDENMDETDEEYTTGGFLGVNWTDFPVMNMHPHAWPLYTVSKLLGIEFNEKGLDLAPTLPKESYRFSSPLFELIKSKKGYSGKYNPLGSGKWRINFRLDEKELGRFSSLIVNGKEIEITRENGMIIVEGDSSPGSPLQWILKF